MDDISSSDSHYIFESVKLKPPVCDGLEEVPAAGFERSKLEDLMSAGVEIAQASLTLSMKHISYGLALTVGSALGNTPPSDDECLRAFLFPNTAGLTVGARAWTKHSHRSEDVSEDKTVEGWWGRPRGSVSTVNQGALELFRRIVNHATWRNIHWLPHDVLVYEMRVKEGYGMRWSQDRSLGVENRPWTFRGFVEPMMENGHELGWRQQQH